MFLKAFQKYRGEGGVKAVWKKSKHKQIFFSDGFPYSDLHYISNTFPYCPLKVPRRFRIGLPKMHRQFRIGPPESVLALLNQYWPS